MNWRKPLIFAGLRFTGSKIPAYLKESERIEKLSPEEIQRYQDEKLRQVLLHAYNNVPYYHRVLPEVGAIRNGNVDLEKFAKIPVLTKDIIREEGESLYSADYRKRKSYHNTSGGSTGEPVRFIQDNQYWQMNIANKLYFNILLGKDVGEKEINLWGSERDIFKNTLSIKERVTNFLYNRTFLNAYRMDEDRLKGFVTTINRTKPVSMWVYVESIDLLAKFIEANGLKVYSPECIITTAGTLFPEIRERVEAVFQCPVYNQYGSREVGPVAVECKHKQGLHCFPWSQKPELIGEGEFKDIIVTDLTNYSMPLIRYETGDIGEGVGSEICKCGRPTLTFKDIKGRITDLFVDKKGTAIYGAYFRHALFEIDWVKKYQIVQKDYDHILYRIVKSGDIREGDLEKITDTVKTIMGGDCKVEFEFVDEIEPSKSGKYLYTISEINR
ncbi:phenylacetate--CoA ligase family protein [Chloroflexota bacterium]